jgi:hypothetical protein
VCNFPLIQAKVVQIQQQFIPFEWQRGVGRSNAAWVNLVVGALRSIRRSFAEMVHIRPVLKNKKTHNMGDHMMAGGK